MVRKRGRKLGKFNSGKQERNSEKINKDTMDKGRCNRACTNQVKEERKHVHTNRDRSRKQKNNAILKALVKAHLWKRQLEGGKGAIARALCTKINISIRYMEEIIR